MKRFISIMLVICTLFTMCALTSCEKEADNKLVIGITEYKPMNYKENGEWTGFDTEFALAVGKELGLEVEFKVIDWNSKWTALSSDKIDCVWNGMTITDEAEKNASVTDAYIINKQVVVMKSDKVSEYADAEAMKELEFAVESGSSGQEVAKAEEFNYTEYSAMSDALLAVSTGKADACIIDATMAASMTGEGTDYAELAVGIALKDEEYGIAFRKDSDLTNKVNKIIKEMKEDGSLQKLADKYKLTIAD